MMKILHFLLSVLPLVNGSSLLKYVPDSAYCTGNLADLEWVSASCPNNDFGCTWGSKALLFVQFNATEDLPYKFKVTVSPSVPGIPSSALISSYEYEDLIMNRCGINLREPAGEDAGYSCPDAGVYNFRSNFTMFGDSSAWYGSWHGFNMGMTVRLYDSSTNEEYASCYAGIQVRKGTYSPATDWALFGGGIASLTGLAAAGYMYRKRRIAAIDLHSESEGTSTHFELVTDPSSRV